MPNDERMKPAEPEARCTHRVILLTRVPTAPAYTGTARQSAGNARLQEKGCCFDSREGSRLVRPMRQIEFIGSALDQEGLRSGIKKRDRNALGLVERAQDCLWGWSVDPAKAGNFTVKIGLLIRK